MKTRAKRTELWLLPILICSLAVAGLLMVVHPASALTADVCMQTNYTNHGKTQALGCSANDVSLARATNISISAGGECHSVNGVNTCSCNSGGNVTFTADYEVKLTAQARYDIGIYFATDGGNALTGQCKLVTLDGSNSDNPVNLDPAPDVCGDIDATHNPQKLHLTLTTPCTPGADGKLKLPNCTSWRQTGANDVCQTATDAFPGSPSKCHCDAGFTIDIFVETATVEVKKSVVSNGLTENGGDVTYEVSIKNLASQATLTPDTLTDNPYGDLTTIHDEVTATNCNQKIGVSIAAGATVTCQFTVHYAGPLQAGTEFPDTVEACGTDNFGHTNICGQGSAKVTVADVLPTAAGCKKAVSVQCAIVLYDVVITNADPAEALKLNTLSDDKFGVITSTHAAGGGFEAVTSTNCAVGGSIAVGSFYNCQFEGMICAVGSHTNKITATLQDDEGNPVTWPDPNNAAQVAKATATAVVQGLGTGSKTTCE